MSLIFLYIASDPLLALQTIDALSLHPSIFWLPDSTLTTLSHPPAPRSHGLAASTILHALLSQSDNEANSQFPRLHSLLLADAKTDYDIRRRLYLAAAMTPFRNATYPEKKKKVLAVEGLIRIGLKVILKPPPHILAQVAMLK